MFGLIYENNAIEKNLFDVSRFVVGDEVIVINPSLVADSWNGINILHTSEPCLPNERNWEEFIPRQTTAFQQCELNNQNRQMTSSSPG